jgi:hypothetical protein
MQINQMNMHKKMPTLVAPYVLYTAIMKKLKQTRRLKKKQKYKNIFS